MKIPTSAARIILVLAASCTFALPCFAKDPCSLLSREEASEMIGAPVVSVTPKTIEKGNGVSCLFTATPGSSITIALFDRKNSTEADKKCDDKDLGQELVTGIGERACLAMAGPFTSIGVAKGSTVLIVAIAHAKRPDSKAVVKQIAEKAISRI